MRVRGVICSIPSRRYLLCETLKSIENQVDRIDVYLNGYTEIPCIKPLKCAVFWHFRDNSLADCARFTAKFEPDEWVFSFDDDLIYPENYVQNTLFKAKKGAIYSYHGRKFDNLPIKSYYKDHTWKSNCLNGLNQDTEIHIGGCGVMCFHSTTLKIDSKLLFPMMSDISIGIMAKIQKIPIICLSRPDEWIKYQEPKETIYNDYYNNDKKQTFLINKYFC